MHCLIIDDHPLFRLSISTIVLAHFSNASICREAGSLEEALPILQQHHHDIILLDLGLPGIDGFEAIQTIRQLHQNVPILMLSGSESVIDMQRCIDAKTQGYISKKEPSHIILSAIETALDGEVFIPNILRQQSVATSQYRKTSESITARQLDVLRLMQQGKRNKEIAHTLQISESTIKVHCRNISRILGVNNRQQAIQEALRLRLITATS